MEQVKIIVSVYHRHIVMFQIKHFILTFVYYYSFVLLWCCCFRIITVHAILVWGGRRTTVYYVVVTHQAIYAIYKWEGRDCSELSAAKTLQMSCRVSCRYTCVEVANWFRMCNEPIKLLHGLKTQVCRRELYRAIVTRFQVVWHISMVFFIYIFFFNYRCL